jgi:hypothetical protein
MKQNNKTKLKIVALVATLLTAVVILSSCEWLKSFFPPKPQEGEKTVAVYIVDAEVVDGVLTGEGARFEQKTTNLDALDLLGELDEQKGVSFDGYWDTTGGYFYITALGGITLDDRSAVLVYIRLKDDATDDTFMMLYDDYMLPCEYEGKTFYPSYALNTIPLFDGMEILFLKTSW